MLNRCSPIPVLYSARHPVSRVIVRGWVGGRVKSFVRLKLGVQHRLSRQLSAQAMAGSCMRGAHVWVQGLRAHPSDEARTRFLYHSSWPQAFLLCAQDLFLLVAAVLFVIVCGNHFPRGRRRFSFLPKTVPCCCRFPFLGPTTPPRGRRRVFLFRLRHVHMRFEFKLRRIVM